MTATNFSLFLKSNIVDPGLDPGLGLVMCLDMQESVLFLPNRSRDAVEPLLGHVNSHPIAANSFDDGSAENNLSDSTMSAVGTNGD